MRHLRAQILGVRDGLVESDADGVEEIEHADDEGCAVVGLRSRGGEEMG